MTSDFNEVKAAVVRYLSSSARKLRDQHSMPGASTSVSKQIPSTNTSGRPPGLQIEFPYLRTIRLR
ncbi:MAG: hypothetical protein ACLUEV_11725 [Alistipes sp.]